MAKIRIKTRIINIDYTFFEEYSILDDETPQEFAEKLIANYNNTLRAGESPREVLGVELIGEEPGVKRHVWEKSNVYTIIDKNNGSYDAMRCRNCKITGKRYGLGGSVQRDYKFRSSRYDYCDGSK